MANTTRIKLWYDELFKAKDQTIECLRDEQGRCCLGVACDVYARETGDNCWEEDCGYYKFDGESDTLPEVVRKWYGFDKNDPELNHDGELKPASSLNDAERLNFRQIAKCVKNTHLVGE